MKNQIYWTKEAEETYQQNINYLIEAWDEQVFYAFVEETEECLALIEKAPNLFPLLNKKEQIHRCKIVKQITLYYKILDKRIDLLAFWNEYQNPIKLKKILKK